MIAFLAGMTVGLIAGTILALRIGTRIIYQMTLIIRQTLTEETD